MVTLHSDLPLEVKGGATHGDALLSSLSRRRGQPNPRASCGGGATLWQPGACTMGSSSECGETCWQPGQTSAEQELSSPMRSNSSAGTNHSLK